MRFREAFSLATKSGLNHIWQNAPVYLRAKHARPTSVYILITSRCTLRCLMCDIPRNPRKDLSIDQWFRILEDLATWSNGRSKLQISGGEPLLYEGIFELLEYATEHNMLPGICTNGTLVTEEVGRKLMRLGLSNINISLDGTEQIHDRIRGAGAFRKTDQAIKTLVRERDRVGASTLLILKTVLMGANAADIPDILEYASNIGADGILFQPIENNFESKDYKLDWFRESNLFQSVPHVMEAAIECIAAHAEKGKLVLNSSEHISSFKEYFRDPSAQAGANRSNCNVGFTNLIIYSDGYMEFCGGHGFGNADETLPSFAWQSQRADNTRSKIMACRKNCLLTCWSHKSFHQKARSFIKIVKGSRKTK